MKLSFMYSHLRIVSLALVLGTFFHAPAFGAERQTVVGIEGEQFTINGEPTYKGVSWNGHKIEGLLMNARLVQGIFDDLNPGTVDRWAYPDTGEWDAERNTREYIEAMESWRDHGLLCFVINLQGGSPEGYSRNQPWYNSAFTDDGSLRPGFMDRLERILDRADELGMVPMVGYFYFGQDQRLEDEEAVIRAVDNATNWILDKGYTNVIIEVNNESDNGGYHHDILKAPRVHELIERVQSVERDGYRLYVSTSYNGGTIPRPNVVSVADYILFHGNGVNNPDRIAEMVRIIRDMPEYTPKPIVNNEDDHYDFDKDWNNFTAAVSEYASWGYFDFRRSGEGFEEGYQSVPADWSISSERKRDFFNLVAEMTGASGSEAEE
ncbi:MAG: hypothetical protein WD490_04880 [Opitutales bacterium]